jgi:hypothetical protein
VRSDQCSGLTRITGFLVAVPVIALRLLVIGSIGDLVLGHVGAATRRSPR